MLIPDTARPTVQNLKLSRAQMPYTSKNLCPSATVVRVHDGALLEEYAVSSTTLVVVDVYWSVDINEVCCMEVCWWRAPLTLALRVCDTEYHMLAVR